MLLSITEWLTGMPSMLQFFWGCALVGSLIFGVQMVLTLLGMDHAGVDAGFDFDGADASWFDSDTMDMGGPLALFSVRGLINFILGLGWGGVAFYDAFEQKIWVVLLAILVGLAFAWIFFYIKKQTRKLEANGAFNINLCLDKTANVYLRIPAAGAGKGKVQISVNGAAHEIDALTQGDELPSGTLVRVVEIIDGHTLRVEKA